MRCRACNSVDLFQIYDLGDMPPVNAFLPPTKKEEKKFPLKLLWCKGCCLVQLSEIVEPPDLFEEYRFLTSASSVTVEHMTQLADILNSKLKITKETKILEIGSNDATLLHSLSRFTNKLLGVDPAKNLSPVAAAKGVLQISDFFTEKLSKEIKKEHGYFDLIAALNVVAHTPDVLDLFRAVREVLVEDGTFIIECPYVGDTILKGEFDTVYHEHVYHFSLTSLRELLARSDLKIYDVERVNTQGGSLRIYVSHDRCLIEESPRCRALYEEETRLGFREFSTYNALRNDFLLYKSELLSLVREKARDKKIIGLGAPARGVVVLNTCNLLNFLDCVVDDTILKQGKTVPGSYVPVISWEDLDPSEACFILLSWNYKDVMLERLKEKKDHAEVIIPFPSLQVVEI